MERCFVVTRADGGWDNVCGVYIANSEEDVANAYMEDRDIYEDMEGMTPLEWLEEHNYVISNKPINNLLK